MLEMIRVFSLDLRVGAASGASAIGQFVEWSIEAGFTISVIVFIQI